ncbi:MAG: hypothetical protein Q7R34_13330 [Dehalococcoidia bacterium]|nr:hypothetical protein [Dehalococcoidia bacterium]
MPSVNTVFGPIHPEQLGVTGIFEHVLWGLPGWINDPLACKNLPYVFYKWHKELVRYKNIGGRTVLVRPGVGMRHQLELFRVLSRSTGVHMVLSTGFSTSTGEFTNTNNDIDYLTELYVTELTQGIGGTKVRAGALRVDCGRYGAKDEDIMLLSAVRAAKKTGCTLMVSGAHAVDELLALNQDGLEPGRVVIGHCDDVTCIKPEQVKELCRQGFVVAFDHIGIEPTWSAMPWAIPDVVRADMVSALISAGYINQVLIAAGTVAGQGDKGFGSHLGVSAAGSLQHFLGQLHRLRIKDDQVNTLLIENPKRVLSF